MSLQRLWALFLVRDWSNCHERKGQSFHPSQSAGSFLLYSQVQVTWIFLEKQGERTSAFNILMHTWTWDILSCNSMKKHPMIALYSSLYPRKEKGNADQTFIHKSLFELHQYNAKFYNSYQGRNDCLMFRVGNWESRLLGSVLSSAMGFWLSSGHCGLVYSTEIYTHTQIPSWSNNC